MEFKMSCAVRAGRLHRAAGLPCQDAAALAREGAVCCAALADGAGSRASSDVGARCVTGHVSRLLCERFEEFWAMENLAGELVRSCTAALAREEPPIYELASTLLFFAAHADGRALSGHLGDGVQVLAEADRLSVFSLPENGDYQNETFFLTAPDAPQRLRIRRTRLTVPGSVLLMSDGAAASLFQQSTRMPAPACLKIARWLQEGDEQTVSQALERNMVQVFERHSGDDLSLAAVAWA